MNGSDNDRYHYRRRIEPAWNEGDGSDKVPFFIPHRL